MIKAAIESGLPPSAVILDDPTREWTALDTKLIKAYWIKQEYGAVPPWIDQSDRVSFEVRSFISKSAAAMERKQEAEEKAASKRGGKRTFGKKYYTVPQTIDDGPMPTIQEWLEEKERKRNGQG